MGVKQVLVLSKSYKGGNGKRCIAGKICKDLPDNKVSVHEWVRPVLIDKDGDAIGAITGFEYSYTNGGALQVLDIAHIPKYDTCKVAGQPDNFVVEPQKRWSKHHTFRADCVFNILDKPDDLWLDPQATTDQVTKAYVESGNVTQSLYLVQPEQLQVTLSNDYNGWNGKFEKKTRASFYYNGVLYENISITCPATRKLMEANYPAEGDASVSVGLPYGDEYAIVLSLSPLLKSQEVHYKFVATIFDKSGALQKDFKA